MSYKKTNKNVITGTTVTNFVGVLGMLSMIYLIIAFSFGHIEWDWVVDNWVLVSLLMVSFVSQLVSFLVNIIKKKGK